MPINKQWVTALYTVISPNIDRAANAIARGQTIGNPTIRALLENQELASTYGAKVNWSGNIVRVEFPKRNFGKEGINYLMSVLMGGQCDVGEIEGCRLENVNLACLHKRFDGPRYGIAGIRQMVGAYNRPLLGAILKPKIGLSPKLVASLAWEMADAGVDFIKEDEILADQSWCPQEERLDLVRQSIKDYPVLYATCISGDGSEVIKKAKKAIKAGGKKIVLHLNLWCSLGAYRDLRSKVDAPIFFQKSGDKVWTTGPFSINYKVICTLVNLAGCDFAHVGMYGGYLAEPIGVLKERIQALGQTIPSFSCGMKPELVGTIRQQFGDDWMATSGGYICGHPKGIREAVREFKEAMGCDSTNWKTSQKAGGSVTSSHPY